MVVGATGMERNVSDLAARLYGVSPNSAEARIAEAALLDANPHLANIDALPAGTRILVPDLPAAAPVPSEVQPLDAAGVGAVATRIESMIGDVHRALVGSLEAQAGDAQHVLDVMTKDIKKKFGTDPLVKLELARAAAVVKGTPPTAKQVTDLIATMQDELKALVAGL